VERRPVAAGVLFGLLACKPQFGLLLPFALMGMRAWRAIAATAATVAMLALLSALVFGWRVWPAWAGGVEAFGTLFSAQMPELLPLMASPAAGLVRVGAPPGLAMAVQVVVSFVVAGAVWLLFRRAPARDAAAALLPAVGLVSPYVFVYDLPVVAGCIAWLFAECHRRGGVFSLAEVLAMLAGLLAPALLLHPWLGLPVLPASQAWLFVVAARRARAAASEGAAGGNRA